MRKKSNEKYLNLNSVRGDFFMNDKNKTKGFWKHIIPYIKPYFKRLIITVICAMVVGAMVAI